MVDFPRTPPGAGFFSWPTSSGRLLRVPFAFRLPHCPEKGASINFVVGHIATLVVGTMHLVRLQSRCLAGDVQQHTKERGQRGTKIGSGIGTLGTAVIPEPSGQAMRGPGDQALRKRAQGRQAKNGIYPVEGFAWGKGREEDRSSRRLIFPRTVSVFLAPQSRVILKIQPDAMLKALHLPQWPSLGKEAQHALKVNQKMLSWKGRDCVDSGDLMAVSVEELMELCMQ